MKRLLLGCVVLALSAGTLRAQQAGNVGAGVILGNPVGGTVKYWMDHINAVDAGLGYSGGDTVFYADYLWHGWKAFPQPTKGKLAALLGLGPRLTLKDDFGFGIRTVVGASYWLEGSPVELFAEIVPVFRLAPGSSVGLDGGVGVRYYFGKFN